MRNEKTGKSRKVLTKIDISPVTFGNGGVKLMGKVLFPDAGYLVPGVILCHGLGASSRAVESSARIMAGRGVAVLVFDFRGHGDSEGVFDENMVEDVVDAWHFLSEYPGVDASRIGLVGHSMGAMAAILASRQINPHALVALSCPPEINGKLKKVADSFFKNLVGKVIGIKEHPRDGAFPWLSGPFAMLSRFMMQLSGYRLRIDWQAFFTVVKRAEMSSALRELKDCPTLFVHCRGDNLTPYQSAMELYGEIRQPKEVLLVKGGFHTAPLLPGKLRRGWTQWAVATLMV